MDAHDPEMFPDRIAILNPTTVTDAEGGTYDTYPEGDPVSFPVACVINMMDTTSSFQGNILVSITRGRIALPADPGPSFRKNTQIVRESDRVTFRVLESAFRESGGNLWKSTVQISD